LALEENAVSESTIKNYLTRLTEEPRAENMIVEDKLKLKDEPRADCTMYDQLLNGYV